MENNYKSIYKTERMCCCLCGHIAKDDDVYESESDGLDEEFPICPECGEWNTGGYSSYAPASLWSESDLKYIIKLNKGGD